MTPSENPLRGSWTLAFLLPWLELDHPDDCGRIFPRPRKAEAYSMEKRLFPFLLFKTLGEFWALLPILVPLYLSCGLKVSDVFLVQRAFALSESVTGIGHSLRSGSVYPLGWKCLLLCQNGDFGLGPFERVSGNALPPFAFGRSPSVPLRAGPCC